MKHLSIAAAFALVIWAGSAQAATIYSYTGNVFSFSSGVYVGKSLSGSISVATPFAANATIDLAALGPDFLISDGVQQVDQNSFSLHAGSEITTDGLGQVATWSVTLGDPSYALTFRSPSPGVGGDGVFDLRGGDIGQGQSQVPGTWSISTVPEPRLACLLVPLLGALRGRFLRLTAGRFSWRGATPNARGDRFRSLPSGR